MYLKREAKTYNYLLSLYQKITYVLEYRWKVPLLPFGTLADYIPFYFWYKNPMLYVIHMGNDPEVIKTPQEKIIYLITDTVKIV